MGIEWQPGPDMSQIHMGMKLLRWTLIGVPAFAGAAWLFYEIVRQV